MRKKKVKALAMDTSSCAQNTRTEILEHALDVAECSLQQDKLKALLCDTFKVYGEPKVIRVGTQMYKTFLWLCFMPKFLGIPLQLNPKLKGEIIECVY